MNVKWREMKTSTYKIFIAAGQSENDAEKSERDAEEKRSIEKFVWLKNDETDAKAKVFEFILWVWLTETLLQSGGINVPISSSHPPRVASLSYLLLYIILCISRFR